MDKQQILNELDALQERMDVLNKLLEDCKYSRWEPKLNEQYYFINAEGLVDTDFFLDSKDITRFKVYNCYETEEQANIEAENILVHKQLQAIATRLNKGDKIDWSNNNQRKYFIAFNMLKEHKVIDQSITVRIPGIVYCLSQSFYDIAVREIGVHRLTRYLRGNNEKQSI